MQGGWGPFVLVSIMLLLQVLLSHDYSHPDTMSAPETVSSPSGLSRDAVPSCRCRPCHHSDVATCCFSPRVYFGCHKKHRIMKSDMSQQPPHYGVVIICQRCYHHPCRLQAPASYRWCAMALLTRQGPRLLMARRAFQTGQAGKGIVLKWDSFRRRGPG